MTACRNLETLLSLYANAELKSGQAEAVAAHLETCSDCRQKVVAYKQMATHLKTLEAPVLPARLFDDFYGGVREKIATNAQARSRALGLLALLHALRCRRRLAFAVAALIAVITVPLLLVNRFFTPPHSRSVLIQLLEERNWPALYSAMLDREKGSSLLNEPVPVELLRAALAELAQAKSQDRLVRAGLVRVLANFKTPEDTPLGLGRSAQILGKVTIKGFELTNRKNRIAWNPEASLQVLLRSSANQTMTIQELLLKTTAKGNRL
jgi:anti-sigma factor RsiW